MNIVFITNPIALGDWYDEFRGPGWYFWNETGPHGPYPSKEQAKLGLIDLLLES